jgi:hypothetical protein
MTELETLLADLQKLTKLPGAVLDLESTVEDNRLGIRSNHSSIGILRENIRTLEAHNYPHPAVKELQARLDALEDIETPQSAMAELNTQVNQLHREFEGLSFRVGKLGQLDAQIVDFQDTIAKDRANVYDNVTTLRDRITCLEESKPSTQSPYGKFSYVLKNDADGFADTSWENIIANGQDLQRPYYVKSEAHWQAIQGDSPSGEGWYGSTEMPVISIVCEEPVYKFRNTARIPGRFRVTSPAHRGSVLRMLGNGSKILHDDTPYGTQTDAPIGLYVEPSTIAPNGMHVRNFEQTIENVSVVGQNGTMPLYIACNAFNLLVQNANFQSHQGAKIVIKHGPMIPAQWYPATQTPSPVYLPDPVFQNLLIEGDHKTMRKACGILASGNNMIFQNLNFYGCLHGLYLHGGQGRVVNGCTMHHGATADGRSWANKEEFLLALVSQRANNNPDSITGNAGVGEAMLITKGSPMSRTLGWHKAGDSTL